MAFVGGNSISALNAHSGGVAYLNDFPILVVGVLKGGIALVT